MDTPTPQTSTQPPASGETPDLPLRLAARATVIREVVKRCTNPQPCGVCERETEDADRLWREAEEALQFQLTLLTQTIDQDRQTIAALREENERLKNEKTLRS